MIPEPISSYMASRDKAGKFIMVVIGLAFLGAGGFFVYNLYSLLMLYSS